MRSVRWASRSEARFADVNAEGDRPEPARDDTRRRVLFFNTWSTAHGGSATSLIDIASNLVTTKYTPLVVCPAPGDLPARLQKAGIPVVLHPLSSLRAGEAARFLRELPWYMRFLGRHRIDLVHGNTGGSRRSLVLASWLCGIPYVQHVRNPVKDTRNGFAFRIAARIITNSNAIAAPLRADPRFASKTVTVHNAVDLSLYDPTFDRRDELGAGDRPIIGFVGQLVPRKGTKVLIEAHAGDSPYFTRRTAGHRGVRATG